MPKPLIQTAIVDLNLVSVFHERTTSESIKYNE